MHIFAAARNMENCLPLTAKKKKKKKKEEEEEHTVLRVQSHDRQKQRYQKHCSPLLGEIAGLDFPPVCEAEPVSLVTKASRSLFTSTCNVAYDRGEDKRKGEVGRELSEALDRPTASLPWKSWTTQVSAEECGQHMTQLN